MTPYEKNKVERLGADAARPHAVTYRKLTRGLIPRSGSLHLRMPDALGRSGRAGARQQRQRSLTYLEQGRIAAFYDPTAVQRNRGRVIVRHEIDYIRPIFYQSDPLHMELWVQHRRGRPLHRAQ